MKKTRDYNVHGMTGTKFYDMYKRAKQRCTNKYHEKFKRYGGRGIRFCFDSFSDFYSYAFPLYKKASKQFHGKRITLDRIDNDGDYRRGNIRFTTYTSNNRNRTNTVRLTYKGQALCIPDWEKKTGIPYKTIYDRHYKGWSTNKIFNY